MLRRVIEFEDFNGDKVEEVHYFNLTKSELIELEAEHSGGLEKSLNSLVEAKDVQTVLSEFKKIILGAYGIKSPDGKRFIKNDQIREEFSQTAAYDALFIEIASDMDAGAKFINAILPRDLAEAVAEQNLQKATAEKLGIDQSTPSTADLARETP